MEEGRDPVLGAVNDLVGNDHVEGCNLLAEAADRAGGDDPLDAQALQGVDIGADGDIGWQDLVATRVPWRIGRNAITIAHEGGHALAAVLTGRRLTGIRLHSDTSGLTLSAGRPRGPGMVFTLLAGYVAPSLVGLAGAWLLGGNRITMLLWVAVALLLAMLVMIRNVFGVVSIVVTTAVVLAQAARDLGEISWPRIEAEGNALQVRERILAYLRAT